MTTIKRRIIPSLTSPLGDWCSYAAAAEQEIERLQKEMAESQKGEAFSDRLATHWQTEAERLRIAMIDIRDDTIIQGMSPALFAEKVLSGCPVEPSANKPEA